MILQQDLFSLGIIVSSSLLGVDGNVNIIPLAYLVCLYRRYRSSAWVSVLYFKSAIGNVQQERSVRRGKV